LVTTFRYTSLDRRRVLPDWGRVVLRNREVLVLLLLAVTVPATAQTFGFSLGAAAPEVCLTIGDATYRVANDGARADYTVRIDPAAPTPDIRIQLAESADTADFVFVDDGDAPARCPRGASGIRSVRTDALGPAADLVIGLATSATPADYRIFVRSRFLAPETAAALFAAAHVPPRVLAGRIAASR
jgi:hypothetical protein